MRVAVCQSSCYAKVPSHTRRFGRLVCSLPSHYRASFQVGSACKVPRPPLSTGTSDLSSTSQSAMLDGIGIKRTAEFEKAFNKLFNEYLKVSLFVVPLGIFRRFGDTIDSSQHLRILYRDLQNRLHPKYISKSFWSPQNLLSSELYAVLS